MNGFTKLTKETEQIQKEEKIELKDIENINFHAMNANIKLILTEDQELRIIQYANKTLEENEKFEVSKTSKEIEIKENKIKIYLFHFFDFTQVEFEIYLPKNYLNKLELKTVSGDIKIDNPLELKNITIETTSADIKLENSIKAQEVNLKTTSGNIMLENIQTDNMEIKSTSGEIEAQEVNAKQIELKTVSGDIKIEKIKGRVGAKSTSGNISLKDFFITGESQIESVSGGVNINLSQESNCRIRTKTTSGSVKLPNKENEMEKESYEDLKIKTTSGNIKVQIKEI